MNNPKIIDTLNLASSLELYQLYTLVGRMIEDPQRIAQIRLSVNSRANKANSVAA